MAVKHTDYECAFQPFVQNREQIAVTLTMFTEHDEGWFYEYDEGRAHCELNSLSESAVHQWALQFQHADDAVCRVSYRELETTLLTLRVRQLTITGVTIREVKPITALAQPKPIPPKRLGQKMREQLEEKEEAIHSINEYYGRSSLKETDDIEIIVAIIRQLKRRIKGTF